MRWVIIVLCAAVLAQEAAAGSNTVYNFLRSDVGARGASLAGSLLSGTDDPDLLFYNPASIATLTRPRASAGFFKQLMDINSGSVSYAQEFEGIGHIGFGVLYTNYGSFTETDEVGTNLGSFGASDIGIVAGYATTVADDLYLGGALTFISSTIAGYGSTGLAVDAGILYRLRESRIELGASVRHLGIQLDSYLGTREELPLDVSVGGSVVPRGLPLLLNLNFHRLNDPADDLGDVLQYFTIGGEFTLSRVLQLRLGYDNGRRKDFKTGSGAGLAGFSVGLGVTVNDYQLGYALSSLGAIGALHRISVGAAF